MRTLRRVLIGAAIAFWFLFTLVLMPYSESWKNWLASAGLFVVLVAAFAIPDQLRDDWYRIGYLDGESGERFRDFSDRHRSPNEWEARVRQEQLHREYETERAEMHARLDRQAEELVRNAGLEPAPDELSET